MRPFFFSLQPPQNVFARIALGVLGFVLLGFFTMFGLAIAGVALAIFALRRLYFGLTGTTPASTRKAPSDPSVIEGEFSVVEKSRPPISHQ